MTDKALKVLVVDDDPIVLEVFSELLDGLGLEVHRRDRALGTSSWILAEKPDMVVLDVQMPGLGGDAIIDVTTRRLGDKAPSFVLLSSMEPDALRALADRCGALGYLHKGEDQQRVATHFAELVARHSRRRASLPAP